ncbi:hypothetical protein MAPG_01465 [Magnaporthiopsis poae ATCC 64411]|uniref:Uncharacterized protein n=1 Tax=Magnaporthiopsis poae (strain ATCC 64411 / 73-15) TaxID=644358 RepID=A0A0C4DNS1_MAGP6|nr:hypothetical protein MAPG_01465 [Magnaporthiopsis poae ATCC 64411]
MFASKLTFFGGVQARRSPSTSPPPRPQAESFMIDGLDADDGYRMVEDEFFSVAGTFTAHLHKAEYHRLKNLAKNKNAVTIRAISRPVVGNKTEAVERRQAAAELAARQKAGIKRARGENASDDDDDDDTDGLDNLWAGTALQGLMARVRPKAVPLSSVVKSNTGAPAARWRDTGYSSPSMGGGSRGMRSGPLAAHSHTGRAVSYAEAGGAGKSVDGLRRAYDESDEDDLDAPSSFLPNQQNVLKCHAPVTGSDPRLLACPLAVTSGASRQTMRKPGTAPRLRDDMAGTTGGSSSHPPRRVSAHEAPRLSAASPERGGPVHDGSGSGSDDDEILQRIRERRKNRMAQARQDTQKEKDENNSTGRDRPPSPVNQQGQDDTLDIIPSFL